MYGINDLDAVVTSNGSFPLAVLYSQATGSKGATFGLLLIIFLSIMICVLGTFLTVSLPCFYGEFQGYNINRLVESGGLLPEITPLLWQDSSHLLTNN